MALADPWKMIEEKLGISLDPIPDPEPETLEGPTCATESNDAGFLNYCESVFGSKGCLDFTGCITKVESWVSDKSWWCSTTFANHLTSAMQRITTKDSYSLVNTEHIWVICESIGHRLKCEMTKHLAFKSVLDREFVSCMQCHCKTTQHGDAIHYLFGDANGLEPAPQHAGHEAVEVYVRDPLTLLVFRLKNGGLTANGDSATLASGEPPHTADPLTMSMLDAAIDILKNHA